MKSVSAETLVLVHPYFAVELNGTQRPFVTLQMLVAVWIQRVTQTIPHEVDSQYR
jgi:hypothetical protein